LPIVPVPARVPPPDAVVALHSCPVGPQSLMTPLTVVDMLLPPTVIWLLPR